MLPEAKSSDLLYASVTTGVVVLSWPQGKVVGRLTGFAGAALGLCTDSSGNVFVSVAKGDSGGVIYEFEHGGTQPIATLSDPGFPMGCSIDPTSGNLAVANFFAPGSQFYHGDVAIYDGAQGSPTIYTAPGFDWYSSTAYDSEGDLFVSGGGGLTELPQGSGTFTNITLNKSIGVGPLQWLNGKLIIASDPNSPRGPKEIYRVAISGASGTIIGTTLLYSPPKDRYANGQFWVQNHAIVGPGGRQGVLLQSWHYPAGGNPVQTLQKKGPWYGVTVSVVPSR